MYKNESSLSKQEVFTKLDMLINDCQPSIQCDVEIETVPQNYPLPPIKRYSVLLTWEDLG
jgi:hypothetical protein